MGKKCHALILLIKPLMRYVHEFNFVYILSYVQVMFFNEHSTLEMKYPELHCVDDIETGSPMAVTLWS